MPEHFRVSKINVARILYHWVTRIFSPAFALIKAKGDTLGLKIIGLLFGPGGIVVGKIATIGGFSSVPRPEVFLRSITALPEK
jgi:hypothetical protein